MNHSELDFKNQVQVKYNLKKMAREDAKRASYNLARGLIPRLDSQRSIQYWLFGNDSR